MLDSKHQEVEALYHRLGIKSVNNVQTILVTGELNGCFSTKTMVGKGKTIKAMSKETGENRL